MSTIDRFMPDFALREVDHVAVAAEPAEAWHTVRAVDLFNVGFARRLFALRGVPERIGAWLHGRRAPPPLTGTIDEISGSGSGFQILADEPPGAVVVGAIGRFWKPSIEYPPPVTPEEFAPFGEPGWGKLAWSLEVEPRTGGGSFVTFDLRVGATDEQSLARFRRYWRLIGRFSHAIRRALMRHFAASMGAAPDARTPLPGDELLRKARFQSTHAIDIEAPPERIWPWLLEIGGHHGQRALLREDRERVLVFGSSLAEPRVTWSFSLEPIGRHATHLTLRERGDLGPLAAAHHELMEFRELRAVKLRAEAT